MKQPAASFRCHDDILTAGPALLARWTGVTLLTSIRAQLRTDCAAAAPIRGLRLFEKQKGGHPVHRDNREARDWLRADSLITCASAIGRGLGGGGGSSFIIQEKPGGAGRRTLGAKRHMQTMPRVSEFRIHWWTYRVQFMAPNNPQSGALLLTQSVISEHFLTGTILHY